jgi:hypothetical protein
MKLLRGVRIVRILVSLSACCTNKSRLFKLGDHWYHSHEVTHMHGRKTIAHVISFTLKMEAMRSSETSVYNKPTRRHIPDYDVLHTRRRKTSHIYEIVCVPPHYLTILLRQSFNLGSVACSVSNELQNLLFREEDASSLILSSLTSH